MKVEELRVGNYLEKDGKIEMVSSIHSDNTIRLQENKNANCHGCYSLNKPIIKPIPLSEDWMLNFNFEQQTSDYFVIDLAGFSMRYYYNFSGSTWKFELEDKIIELYYVHQLQNLFHSLTGEELTLKTTL